MVRNFRWGEEIICSNCRLGSVCGSIMGSHPSTKFIILFKNIKFSLISEMTSLPWQDQKTELDISEQEQNLKTLVTDFITLKKQEDETNIEIENQQDLSAKHRYP